MPDYCTNVLHIIGTKKELIEFDNKFKGEYLTFTLEMITQKMTQEELDRSIEDTIKDLIDNESFPDSHLEVLTDEIRVDILEVPHYKCNIIIPYKISGYSFNTFIPLPIDQIENWFAWRDKNWNTKWDIIELYTTLDEIDDLRKIDDNTICSIYYDFSTAWTPSLYVTEKMAEVFPNLSFEHKYIEESACFAGKLRLENGEIIEDTHLLSVSEVREFSCNEFGENYIARCPHCSCLIADHDEDSDTFGNVLYMCPSCKEQIYLTETDYLTYSNNTENNTVESDYSNESNMV